MVIKEGRQRIERAALELFATRGIDNASTRDIAQHAGVAEGTLYRHFRTKEELAVSIFLSLAARLVGRLDRALERGAAAPDKMAAIVDAFFEFAQEEPLGYDYVIHHHPRLETLPPGTRLPKDVVFETLQRLPRSACEPALGTAILVGMIVRTLFFLRQGLLQRPADSVRAELTQAALRVFEEKP
jgi:AcrR family transcriptional regulator